MASQLPVFVFPHALTFTRQNRIQTLTIYNPYDFAVRYSVLSTAPQSFSVASSDGTIRARCCLDIVIRLLDSDPRDAYFQVLIHEVTRAGQMPRSGRRQLSVNIMSHELETDTRNDELPFRPVISQSSPSSSSSPPKPREYEMPHPVSRPNFAIFYLIAFIAFIVISLPALPNNFESESYVPQWMHLSVNVKLVAAYILGIVTVAILRS